MHEYMRPKNLFDRFLFMNGMDGYSWMDCIIRDAMMSLSTSYDFINSLKMSAITYFYDIFSSFHSLLVLISVAFDWIGWHCSDLRNEKKIQTPDGFTIFERRQC